MLAYFLILCQNFSIKLNDDENPKKLIKKGFSRVKDSVSEGVKNPQKLTFCHFIKLHTFFSLFFDKITVLIRREIRKSVIFCYFFFITFFDFFIKKTSFFCCLGEA